MLARQPPLDFVLHGQVRGLDAGGAAVQQGLITSLDEPLDPLPAPTQGRSLRRR